MVNVLATIGGVTVFCVGVVILILTIEIGIIKLKG